VFSWDGHGWDKMPGALTCVSVGSAHHIWGVNREQQIWFWAGGSWQLTDGAAVQLSVGEDGTVACINSSGEVFRRFGSQGHWEKLPGNLKVVSVHNAQSIIGNNNAGEVWALANGDWVRMPGTTTHISTGGSGNSKVWGVNASGEVWRHG